MAWRDWSLIAHPQVFTASSLDALSAICSFWQASITKLSRGAHCSCRFELGEEVRPLEVAADAAVFDGGGAAIEATAGGGVAAGAGSGSGAWEAAGACPTQFCTA